MSTITVVDYGIGNLLSVTRALEHCGATVEIAHDAATIAGAARVLLPGVGAFADGMEGLRQRGLVDALRDFAASGRPLLGICLGMQLLLERSHEFGEHEGLGIIPGEVVPIPRLGADGRPHKIPHIGWNGLLPPPGRDWNATAFGTLKPGTAVYFVHSFMAMPADPQHRLADCDYDGIAISAAIAWGHVHGYQFHPEKSGEAGLQMLRAFLASG